MDTVKSSKTGLLVTKEGKNIVKITKAVINTQNKVQRNIQDPEEIENIQALKKSEILTSRGK